MALGRDAPRASSARDDADGRDDMDPTGPHPEDLSAYRVACLPWIAAGIVNIVAGWLVGAVAWTLIGWVLVVVWMWLVFAGVPIWPSQDVVYYGIYVPLLPVFAVPTVGLLEVIVGIVGLVRPGPWLRGLPLLCVFGCVLFDVVSLLAGLTSGLLLWRSAVRAQRRDDAG